MKPLAGTTIVTLEHAIAAPSRRASLPIWEPASSRWNGPVSASFARGYDERVNGLASHFVWTNRSKESLTLDVKHPEARTILKRLITEQADVVVQNLAPGAAARLGLSYEALSPINPRSSSAISPATAMTALPRPQSL